MVSCVERHIKKNLAGAAGDNIPTWLTPGRYRIVENFGKFGELLQNSPKFNPPKVYCNILVVSQITHMIAIFYT